MLFLIQRVSYPWFPPFIAEPLQVTLQVRIYALYQRSKTILALMIFGYVCEFAAVVTILGFLDAYAQSMSVCFLAPSVHSR